ncbi:hypothetical protein WM15_30610 [Burkholderia ubonensis]|nr:hypothetical protein WM15_30610 [Burkholderia ubonensis]
MLIVFPLGGLISARPTCGPGDVPGFVIYFSFTRFICGQIDSIRNLIKRQRLDQFGGHQRLTLEQFSDFHLINSLYMRGPVSPLPCFA